MGKKILKHKKGDRTRVRKIIPQKQKKSSWGAVLVSVFKEFFLNFPGPSPGRLSYDEDLTDEGKRRKDLILGPIMLIFAVASALLPLKIWDMIVPDVLAGKIFVVVMCECFAVFVGSGGIITIKDALKKK